MVTHSAAAPPTIQTVGARTTQDERAKVEDCADHACASTDLAAPTNGVSTIPMCRNTLLDCVIRATKPEVGSSANTDSATPNTFSMLNLRVAYAVPTPRSSTTITPQGKLEVDSVPAATSTSALSKAGTPNTAAGSTPGLPKPLIANRFHLSPDGFAPLHSDLNL